MKIKKLVPFFFLLLFCGNLFAQLNLIPFPKTAEIKEYYFTISNQTKIIYNELDNFYTSDLSECINQEFNVLPKQSKKAKKNYIEFILASDSVYLKKTLTVNNLDANFNPEKEGYIIDVSTKRIIIIANTKAGIFYGVQTLKQLISANNVENSIPCITIYDKPDIAIRAWQDDISRGPIPKMETLKEQISKLASYKLNYFTLYIEHVFKLEKHPGIAPADGITKEQINELTIYAAKHHIKLIGSYQSFGHMEETLCHPDYIHLAENSHIISPVLDESYEFLSDVYSELVPSFSGEYFNINCDETFGLGDGKSKDLVDSIGIDGVYLQHINKLDKILDPYGKKILMWGDIVTNHPQIIDQLPNDITVIAWGYHPAENFNSAITPITNTGLNFWVAPGVSCWRNIYPDYHSAEINIYNFIRDGYIHDASGVLNTTWDDDGFNFFENNWHGLIWGAENCWNAPKQTIKNDGRKLKYKNFNKSFDAIFYGLNNNSITDDIITFSQLRSFGLKDIFNNARIFEPIFPIHKDQNTLDIKLKNIELLRKLQSIETNISKTKVNRNKTSIEYLNFAIQQLHFIAKKNILRIDINNYLKTNNIELISEIKPDISELVSIAKELKSEYAKLWKNENRDHWLDVNMQKYDDLISYLINLEGHCIITPSDKITDEGRKIKIRSLFDDLSVYYSISDFNITKESQIYSDPFYINSDATIKAGTFKGNDPYPTSESKLIHHKAIGKLKSLNCKYSTYHPSYDGGGINALLDGIEGDRDNLRSGKWQGFSGQNIDIEIDLEKIQDINSFSMGFYQNTFSWVIFPTKVDIFFKNEEEKEYELLKTITSSIPPEENGNLKHNYKAEFKNTKARYIKVVAQYYGKLPEWHHAGSEYESMLFSDEIIIK